jgi:hypothetical protein
MIHKIDRQKGILPGVDPFSVKTKAEANLALMRYCVQCGRYLHPKVWNESCAYTRPEYRLERLGKVARGTILKG